MKASVIISTYNAVEWLEKVLWGFSVQSEKDFEIVIADDGSRAETTELITRMIKKIRVPVVHIWHEDLGFRKTEILNKAVMASNADYLIFTDGDCIPRKDFVEAHIRLRKPGHFLSGGYFKLPLGISTLISQEDIESQRCFDLKWLRKNGLTHSFKNTKFVARGFWAALLNSVTTTKPSWNGHNASGWKKDIIAVNGFNQDMQYGGEDREFGERLVNNGVQARQIRYSAICVHLEHERSYANDVSKMRNQAIRKFNKKNQITTIRNGIKSTFEAANFQEKAFI